LMNERYDEEGSIAFKWIKEDNPDFSVELFKALTDQIASLRAEFATVQKRLIDIKREHDNLRQKFPSSLFVGSREALKVNIVTSTATEKAFAEHKEDDLNL